MWIVIILIFLIGLWFYIPYSPLKSSFYKDNETLKMKQKLYGNEIFSEDDFSNLPDLIQNYIQSCGYIGTKKMNQVCMMYRNVDFSQSQKGPKLKINYTQYNTVKEPARNALIESYMFGIPFQGYDYYREGTGGMKGVLAKSIPLFNQRGKEMDQACLATYLAECLFIPTVLLQDFIEWKEMNDYQIQATIHYKDVSAKGVFTFNSDYEMISFTTTDRAIIGNNGEVEYVPWTAKCDGYKTGEDGIKHPSTFQAIWNFENLDFIYFDGNIHDISYE